MGHERVGTLPKTHKWRTLVGQIAGLRWSGIVGSSSLGGASTRGSDGDETAIETSNVKVPDIAGQTVQNVSQQFRRAHLDSGVSAAFEFLVILAAAGRSEDPRSRLAEYGIELTDRPSALTFAKAAKSWLADKQDSLEYGQMARGAVSDAIAAWYREHKPPQDRLFEPSDDSFHVWRRAGNGAGFCELARLFFASFTERYLNYFLEREASAVLPGLSERDRFGERLEEHIDGVSQHAFETARIAQSFAADWFNNYVVEGAPDREAIRGFLYIAFGKIRSELLREETEA